jgi:PKD repeat protein
VTGGSGIYTSFVWSLGNGSVFPGPSVNRTYSTPGSYPVFLTVTDSDGLSSRSSPLNLTVTPDISVAITSNVTSGRSPLGVGFQALPSGGSGNYTRFLWTFGDGGNSSLEDPSHLYSLPGIFPVRLQVTDSFGSTTTSGSLSIDVTPGSGPVLTNVTVTPLTVVVGTGSIQEFNSTLTCSGGSCPAGATYDWTLNNTLGTLTPQNHSSVLFTAGNAPGEVLIHLNVTLQGVTVASSPLSTIFVEVPKVVSVAIAPMNYSLAPGQGVELRSTVGCGPIACGPGVTYRWSLDGGEGTLSSTTTPLVLFSAGTRSGTALVFLNVSLHGSTTEAGPISIVVSPSASAPTPPFYDFGAFWILLAVVAIGAVAGLIVSRWVRERRAKSTPRIEPDRNPNVRTGPGPEGTRPPNP